jgi:hypothetical protein
MRPRAAIVDSIQVSTPPARPWQSCIADPFNQKKPCCSGKPSAGGGGGVRVYSVCLATIKPLKWSSRML